ncbi:MAG TPA: hypothetical protein VMZ26_04545 [Pyrinomonadaceae bacterium]|nr:hypothetical protein [Pyrinomonadaceae bacterium]
MKLRMKSNSIRLRLLRSEVERFATAGQISEEIEFGTDRSSYLRYSLVTSPDADSVSARFWGSEISIVVPVAIANKWTSSDEVGFESEQPIGGDGSLKILVEKDFECIDRPDDPDRADAFPNPNVTC